MKTMLCAYALFLFGIPIEMEDLNKTYHKTIEVDEIENISMEFGEDEVEILPWDGNVVMLETQVEVRNTSSAVFTYFERSGRYEMLTETEGQTLVLSSKKKKQQSVLIKGAKKDTFEKVSIKIYMPSGFEEVSENNWQRSRAF